MYIPPLNEMDDPAAALKFMQTYSFATIINSKDDRPVATHLPFVVKQGEDDSIQLIAHFAKANPQCQLLEETTSLVVFQEPHAYISPSHYNKKLEVPTWNYVAVHAYGKAKVVKNRAIGFEILEELIQTYEEAYQEQWKSLPGDYKQAMYEGIVPFVLEVTKLETKAKLSQNKKADERARIANALTKSKSDPERLIGEMMKE